MEYNSLNLFCLRAMMKILPCILIFFAICALLVACAPQAAAMPTLEPTPGALPLPTGTKTPTSEPSSTPTSTEIPRPPLPDWAKEYVTNHQAIYEHADGNKEYYLSDKQVTVNGETRYVRVKLVEYDSQAQEWIPCYETVQELLNTQQVGSLLQLNNIHEPQDAVWMIRAGGRAETADLLRLETIFDTWALETEKTFRLSSEENETFWPVPYFERRPGGLINYSLRCTTINCQEFNIKPRLDGVRLNEPHSWINLRRGTTDQIIAGVITYDEPGIIWLGLDCSGFNYQDPIWSTYNNFTPLPLDQTLFALFNLDNQIKDLSFTILDEAHTGENPAKAESYADVLTYFNNLPEADRNYLDDSLSRFTVFGRQDNSWAKALSGKILWVINPIYYNKIKP